MWLGLIAGYIVAFGLEALGVPGLISLFMFWSTFLGVWFWWANCSPWAIAREKEIQKEAMKRWLMEEEEKRRIEAENQERKQREAEKMRKEREAETKRREDRFLRYLFSMLAKLAKADGHIDASEVKMAENVFARFDFAARRRKFCAGVFNEAKDSSQSISWYAEQFGEQVDDESICIFVYELLWDVACADGWLHPTEKEVLRIICANLRIPETYFHINYRRRFGTFQEGDKKSNEKQSGEHASSQSSRERSRPYDSRWSTILEAYEILECDPAATTDELKASFHKVAKRYHPDLLRSNGVPEEMIKKATEKMVQINAAWEDIRRTRGI